MKILTGGLLALIGALGISSIPAKSYAESCNVGPVSNGFVVSGRVPSGIAFNDANAVMSFHVNRMSDTEGDRLISDVKRACSIRNQTKNIQGTYNGGNYFIYFMDGDCAAVASFLACKKQSGWSDGSQAAAATNRVKPEAPTVRLPPAAPTIVVKEYTPEEESEQIRQMLAEKARLGVEGYHRKMIKEAGCDDPVKMFTPGCVSMEESRVSELRNEAIEAGNARLRRQRDAASRRLTDSQDGVGAGSETTQRSNLRTSPSEAKPDSNASGGRCSIVDDFGRPCITAGAPEKTKDWVRVTYTSHCKTPSLTVRAMTDRGVEKIAFVYPSKGGTAECLRWKNGGSCDEGFVTYTVEGPGCRK